MVFSRLVLTVCSVILLSLLQVPLEGKRLEQEICPIGYQIAHKRFSDKVLCYRLKGPENFTDTFKDCSGNLYTSKLFDNLEISNYTEHVLWTEYKSAYPGGPFIDTSLSTSGGSLLETSFDFTESNRNLEEELCIVKQSTGNYTAVSCDGQYYRYCFVEALDGDNLSTEGCEALNGSRRFWSPIPVCLTALPPVRRGAVRATWSQAKNLCVQRGGDILYSGWRYSNFAGLHNTDSHVFPIRVIYDLSHNNTVRNGADFMKQPMLIDGQNITFGALNNSETVMVNSSYVFYNVICEKDVETKEIILSLTADERNRIVLAVNYNIDHKDLLCFTDSKTYYPTHVEIIAKNKRDYILKPEYDGHYWCLVNNTKWYNEIESNKLLWIREKQSLENTYAVKLYFGRKFIFHNIDEVSEIWEKILKEYIYYTTEFYKMNMTVPSDDDVDTDMRRRENDLRRFKEMHPKLSPKGDILYSMKVKRIYLDGNTALVHFQLNPTMKPVQAGWWSNLRVFYMKPVHYCTLNSTKFEYNHTITKDCAVHKCVGDFINGVQVVTVIDKNCENLPNGVVQRNAQVTVSMPSVATVVLEQSFTRDDINLNDKSSKDYLGTTTYTDGTSTLYTEANELFSTFISKPTKTTKYELETTTETPTLESAATVTTMSTILTDYTTLQSTSTEMSTELPKRDETYLDSSNSSEEYVDTTLSAPATSLPVHRPKPTRTTIYEPEKTTQTTESFTLESVITAIPSIPTMPIDYTSLPPTTTEISTELPPDEQLQQVINDLEDLINNSTEMLPINAIDEPFNNMNQLLYENVSLKIPSQLLHLLDKLGARLDLNGSKEVQAVESNIALLVASAEPGMPVNGLRIAARDNNNTFSYGDFEIIRGEMNTSHLLSEESEAVVHLPTSVANANQRISFVVFRNDRAFQTNSSLMAVNSRVLSINVPNVTQFEEHESIDIHFSPIRGKLDRNETRTCAYWHFVDLGSGYWSEDGCSFIAAREPGMLDTCRCTHLTHFAEILVSRELFSDLDEKILEIISVVGCCLSVIGLVMIGITAALFRSWRRDFNNKIWLQLCISIMLLVICFLIVVFAKFRTYNIPCILTGIALHYAVLASFCWMLVAAILSYRRLVMVFSRDASHKLLKAAAFAWGAPFAIVGVLLSANPQAYERHFEYKSPAATFCYPSGLSLWLAIYAPIAIMLLTNWTLFILIVRSVFASRGIQRHGNTNEAIRCASVSCLLVFLFGLPWIFGVFAYNIVAAYLFALTATFQGFVLFIFFVAGNKKTRDLWFNKLKIKQTRKVPVTSSTYTNRSTGAVGWRGGTVEAKVSKPKSLTSPDDSRFS